MVEEEESEGDVVEKEREDDGRCSSLLECHVVGLNHEASALVARFSGMCHALEQEQTETAQ